MKAMSIASSRLGTGWRFLIALTALSVLAASVGTALAAGAAGPPTTTHNIQPVALDGNQNCSLPGDGDFELRVNAPGDGTFFGTGGFSVTLDVYTTAQGQAFDFIASGGAVETVYVKAGPDTNRYDYPAPVTSDTFLHGTINPNNGRFYGLSHISFCFNLTQETSVTTSLHETDAAGTDVTPANNGASITVLTGAYVKDVATVTPSGATGTVSFTYYPSLADCQADTNGTSAGSSAVSGGTAESSVVQFNSVGTFYWLAEFDGSGNFNDSSSVCGDEVLTVRSNTTVVTSLHETDSAGTDVTPANNGASITVTVGAYVKDVATVTPSGATGTVSFTYYPSLADCQADTNGTSAGSSAVSGGTAESSVVQFNSVGTFYWLAEFDATGLFNDSSSVCGDEVLTVNLNQPGIATAPWVIPNDDATLSGLFGAGPFGSITFELWDDATCDGNMLYTETVTVTGDGTFSTDNPGTGAGGVVIDADDIVYWYVEYTGNAENAGAVSDCEEIIDVDLTP